MRREGLLCAAAALVFAAGIGAMAKAPRAEAAEPAPSAQALRADQDTVAALTPRTAALPESDRRNAAKLLREASSRLAGATQLSSTTNPRLAKYARRQAEAAASRIESAREVIEQGGSR